MPAIFSDFTSYKNGRSGAIASKIGDVRFVNFSVADNKRAGIEASEVATARDTALTTGALIIGHSGNQEPSELLDTGEVGVIGFWAPQDENYTLTDTVLANFDVDGYAALSDCNHCNFPNTMNHGAKRNGFSGLTFVNAPRKLRWEGPRPGYGIFEDLDGSLTGAAGSFVVADWPHLHTPDICSPADETEFPRSLLCDASANDPRFTAVRKFEFSGQVPAQLATYKFMGMQRSDGGNVSDGIAWMKSTFFDPKEGWACGLVSNQAYTTWWVDPDAPVNLNQIDVKVSELGLGETVLLSFNYSEYRDRFQVTDLVHGGVVNTSATPLYGGEPTGTGYLQPFGGDPEATNGTFTVAFTGSQAFQQKIRIEAFVRAHPSSLELSVTHPFVSQHHSSHTHTHTQTHTHTHGLSLPLHALKKRRESCAQRTGDGFQLRWYHLVFTPALALRNK